MGKHEPLMKVGKNETSPLLNEKKSDGFYGGTSKSDGDDKRCRSSTVPHQWRPAILTSSEALKNEKIGSSSANLGQFDELDERSSSIAGTPSGTSVESSPVSTSSENETSDSGPHVPYTRSQWAVLLVLYFATLTSSFAVCLFPPFFPQIAESKGAPASVYGFIIGTNCLTSFIVTPIIGKHLNKIGLRFAFVSGLFISGGCCFLSGFLEFFPNGLNFVLQAIAIRVVHATGNAFVIVSTFAYIALEFPHSVARIFSMTRAMMNVAQLLGPVVGGALYEVGGFKMPFIIMGMVQMSMALPSHYLLPEYDEDEEENKKKQPTGIFRILAIPTIWIALSNIIFSTMSNGFLSITLEPQVLRQFNLSPFYVGLVFGLKDGANAAFSPVWGYLSDRDPRHNKGFIFLTAALGAFSFVLLGPFPGLPIKETLTIAIIALTLNGIAISGQQVAGMVDALNEAINAGYPDSPDTHGVVSGVWSSLSGGGRFISRCFAGILVDAIGFRDASTIIVFLQASIAIVALGFFLTSTSMRCRLKPRKRKFISVGKGQAHMCTTATPSEPVMSKSLSVRTTGAHRRRAFSKSFDYTSSFEA